MNNNMFSVRVMRDTAIDDRHIQAGSVIEVEAATAATLVRDGQARLVDLADLGPLLDLVCPAYRRAA